MPDKEKKKLLEAIKNLPPEKRGYVVGVAQGLAMSEPSKEEPKEEQPKPA